MLRCQLGGYAFLPDVDGRDEFNGVSGWYWLSASGACGCTPDVDGYAGWWYKFPDSSVSWCSDVVGLRERDCGRHCTPIPRASEFAPDANGWGELNSSWYWLSDSCASLCTAEVYGWADVNIGRHWLPKWGTSVCPCATAEFWWLPVSEECCPKSVGSGFDSVGACAWFSRRCLCVLFRMLSLSLRSLQYNNSNKTKILAADSTCKIYSSKICYADTHPQVTMLLTQVTFLGGT